MNRKLMVLNIVLAGAIVFLGVKWRERYQAEKAREEALRNAVVKPFPALPFHPLPSDPPAVPVAYQTVAMKTLFHPSRDPNEPIEPPPLPPPPPPMPELPRYHGQMNLGDGPEAILVERPGSAEKVLKIGDVIGQFKLTDVNTNEITFEWTFNGATVRRTLSQLLDRTASASAGPDNSRPVNSAMVPLPPPPPVVMSNKGAGEQTSFGFKTCLPDDSSPEGTVDRGFRKVITQTPFGKSCRWDPVGGR